MKIIDMPRGTGKTYQLAQISEARNVPIIVHDKMQVKIQQAKYPKAHFMSYEEYIRLPSTLKPVEILIDEFPFVLREIFDSSVILAATYSSEDEMDDRFFVQLQKGPTRGNPA